jgi:hypothetical protein
MNQNSEMDDELRPEYDFSQMPMVSDRPWVIVARGSRRTLSRATVQLEPDVAALFPDDASVNEALRLMIRMMQSQKTAEPIVSK